jgi:nucleoside-diphosphate-sugar epimerase
VQNNSVIFHLAALIGIPYSYEAPLSYLDTNIAGTMHVMNAARQKKAKRVVVVSTSEVYGTALRVPIDEGHPLQGQSPYSASKIAAEKMAESYHLSFGLPVSIVRPFNTYGPRQSARAVIPTIISQILAGKKSLTLGDITTTRDFCFVKDTAKGLMQIAASPNTIGRTVNIGTGRDVSIKETAETIARIAETSLKIKRDPKRIRPKKSEVRRLCADNSLLKELTGWAPRTSLEAGLKQTFKWFKGSTHEFDANRYYV